MLWLPTSVELPAWTSHQSVSAFADIAKSQAAAAGQPPGKAVTIHPPRATDAFYAKLLPALEVFVCLQNSYSMCLQNLYSMCDMVVYSECGVCYLMCACVTAKAAELNSPCSGRV